MFGHQLLNFKDVYALDEADLGKIYLMTHKTETSDFMPIKQNLR